jgi:hypothetical protein
VERLDLGLPELGRQLVGRQLGMVSTPVPPFLFSDKLIFLIRVPQI